MTHKHTRFISEEELEELSPEVKMQLNLVTRFWFEVVVYSDQGVIRKPTPRQILNFILKHNKKDDLSKKVLGQKLSKNRTN